MSRKTKLRHTIALMRQRLAANEQGATAIEYAMIAAGIGVAIAATVIRWAPSENFTPGSRRCSNQSADLGNQKDF